MPFPRAVKDELLVKGYRHCCVCHKNERMNVEVHDWSQPKGSAKALGQVEGWCGEPCGVCATYGPLHRILVSAANWLFLVSVQLVGDITPLRRISGRGPRRSRGDL
jgi:hypothetical protein